MYKVQKMTARWQRVGCLLMAQHASFTSLIAVSSGKTTGYVRVITADMEAADCHLLCLGNDAMEPVIVLYIASLTGATI